MNFSQKFQLLCHFAGAKFSLPRSRKRQGTLVIRLDRIGDFALYAPFAQAAFDPEGETFFLVNELWSELCVKLFPSAKVIPLAPGLFLKDPVYRAQKLAEVRALSVRRVVQPRFYRELFVEELIALAANPEETIRFQTTDFHLQPGLLKLLSAAGAEELPYLPEEHELQRNARFAQLLAPGFEVKNPWCTHPFQVPEQFRAQEYVCIFPGSGKGNMCCWQVEKWGELLNALDFPFYLICGTPAEKNMIEEILKLLPPQKAAAVTSLSLAEFAGVVSHARCALGNDTGGIHLAAMSGVPSLAISGRGQPGWFLPYPAERSVPGVVPPLVVSTPEPCENCFWRCKDLQQGVCRCVAEISVRQVQESIENSNFSALR